MKAHEWASDVDTLRFVARKIREQLCYGGSGHPFYAAIADWLDYEAEWFSGTQSRQKALAVAHAYLPDTPEVAENDQHIDEEAP